MTGSIALDVVIGLVFIYTLYSLLTTTIVELIATLFQFRARNLVKGIERMLDDNGKAILSQKFYDTPLIKYMASGLGRIYNKPSYIQARNFSKALIQVLKDEVDGGDKPSDKIRAALEKYKDTQTGKFLLNLLDEADNDLQKFTASLETWFDDTQERVAGWYKRKILFVTFLVGLVVAILFNIDTIQIAGNLSKDPKVREQYVKMAGQLASDTTLMKNAYDKGLAKKLENDSAFKANKHIKTAQELKEQVADSVGKAVLEGQKVLIGRMDTLYAYIEKSDVVLTAKRPTWKFSSRNSWMNLLGCLLTAIALSLGAPFWFDLLNKLVKLRGSIAKVESGGASAQKDKSGESQKTAVG
ncbi:MAG: hypothetical protein EHM93_16910 [Bacteroidales bacterium]|nr:MAG: hypothetical protein EHM93_16910 [Bacteroidales bacterium]